MSGLAFDANPADASAFTDDLTFALRLAEAAAPIALERFQAVDLSVSTKPDRTPVTEADLAVENAIRNLIAIERSGDSIYGEEFSDEAERSGARTGRTWIIDPIDGTANFLRGVPIWATLIALAVDGVPVVGVCSAPALGRTWWAARGSGAWTDQIGSTPGTGRKLAASDISALSDSSFSFQSIAQWRSAGYSSKLEALSTKVWRDRAYGDFWSYMLLAEGSVDAVAEFDVKPYDLAALIPIIEESGGSFTSVTGTPGPWESNALATNGRLHEQYLAELS